MAKSTAISPTSPMTSFCSSRIRGTAGSMAIRRSNSSASTCRGQRNSNASPSARAKDPMMAAPLHRWVNGDAAFEFLGSICRYCESRSLPASTAQKRLLIAVPQVRRPGCRSRARACPGPAIAKCLRTSAIEQRGRTSTISRNGCPADNPERETDVTGHPASLSAFALLGKDTPRPGSQGRKLELSRYSGMDAAPQADADDRRLSANSDSSSRGGVLLRHASHSPSHRRTGLFGLALSEKPGRSCKSSWLVDREGLLHECRLSHDRQHAWTAQRTCRGTTSALPG